jgi:hypothetical protein
MRDRTPKRRKNSKFLWKLILEKSHSTAYTSTQLAKSRVLKLHRRLNGAGGSVQQASIKNWRYRYSFHLFFWTTFDTRLRVILPADGKF